MREESFDNFACVIKLDVASLGNKVAGKTCLDVDNIAFAVGVVTGVQLFPSVTDLVGQHGLAVRVDVVLVAQLEELLSGSDTANERASNGLASKHERQLGNLMRLVSQTQLNDDARFGNKRQVEVDVVVNRHRVQDQVAGALSSFHGLLGGRCNKGVSALGLCNSLFIG